MSLHHLINKFKISDSGNTTKSSSTSYNSTKSSSTKSSSTKSNRRYVYDSKNILWRYVDTNTTGNHN